jgi:hypothetical protein
MDVKNGCCLGMRRDIFGKGGARQSIYALQNKVIIVASELFGSKCNHFVNAGGIKHDHD